MRLVPSEREAVCDTMIEVGPDAPTLCEGWTVLDLAAHLVVRERRPVAAPGPVVPALLGPPERLMAEQAAKGLPALVEALRAGPPAWSPFTLSGVDAVADLAEWVVHHEDVRRADGRGPRTDVAELAEEVWRTLHRSTAPMLAGLRLPVVAAHADGRRTVLRHGPHPVVLTGEPIELLLHLSGRREASEVEVTGPPLSVTRYREQSSS